MTKMTMGNLQTSRNDHETHIKEANKPTSQGPYLFSYSMGMISSSKSDLAMKRQLYVVIDGYLQLPIPISFLRTQIGSELALQCANQTIIKQHRQMFKRVDNQDMIEEKLADGSIKRYVKGRLLGKGGFAKCYEVISLQTQKKYAAKVIEKASLQKSKAKEKLTSQIKIHKSIAHPYVVHFEHYFEDAEFVYILLEKCSNQTLNELLKRRKRLTDVETKYYIRQLAEAIKYFHQQQVIHRDLKLGNLFLSEKLEVKIGDFGLATKLTHPGQRKKTKCGTPNYIAPEILDQKKTHSFQVDIWSMGVIAYALLVGKPPFETNDVKTTYNKIKVCSYSFPDSANVSELAKNFISRMLQLDPCKRATIDEVLADPFLNPATVPHALPISSLACPPSYDFLKKYKDLEKEQANPELKNFNQSLDKYQFVEEQKKHEESDFLSHEKQLPKKLSTRVSSVEKSLKSTNRVFSAANLLGDTKTSRKTKKIISELQAHTLKVWVTYFQENPKYGLAYMLNSNSIGFKFNDKTAAISNSRMNSVKYLEYNPISKAHKQSEARIYKAIEFEAHQPKKSKILNHFYRQLLKRKQESESTLANDQRIRQETAKHRETPESAYRTYVTRYHCTSKCTILWLSCNAMQVIFEDETQLLLSANPQGNIFTYVGKNRDRVHFQEKKVGQQSEEVRKRLAYFYKCTSNITVKKSENTQPAPTQRAQNDKKPAQTLSRSNSTKFGNVLDFNSTKSLRGSASNAVLQHPRRA